MKLSMPYFFVLVILLFAPLHMLAQDEETPEMILYQKTMSVMRSMEAEDFSVAEKKAIKLFDEYPDSARVLALLMSITAYNITQTDIYDEIDEGRFEKFIAIVDTKFPNNEILDVVISNYWNEIFEPELVIERLNKHIEHTTEPELFPSLLQAYYEMADSVNYLATMGILKEKSKRDIVFKRTLVSIYLDHSELDSALLLISEIMRGADVTSRDYQMKAFVNYSMKDKIEACESLRMARRKGVVMEQPWMKKLNCYNEDRSNPKAIEFDTRFGKKEILVNGPESVNRAAWQPKLKRKIYFDSNEGEGQFSLMCVPYYNQYFSKGYVYFFDIDGPAFYNRGLRLLTVMIEKEWNNRSGDTLIGVDYMDALPNVLEKGNSVWLEIGADYYIEFSYLGYEPKTLKSGETISSAKIRVAYHLDGYLNSVELFWMADQRGVVEYLQMDGSFLRLQK